MAQETAAKLQENPSIESRTIKNRYRMWMVALAIAFIAGFGAIAYRTVEGLAVTNLTNFVPWGAWIVFYIFFVGLSAGAFLLSTLIFVFGMNQYEKVGRIALFTALICMIVALTLVFIDLGQMFRGPNALLYWNVLSILSWEVRFYMVYIVLLAVELWFAMRIDLIKLSKTATGAKQKIANFLRLGSDDVSDISVKKDHRMMKILGIIGIPVAIIGVHGGTGSLFAVVKAEAYWNTPLFPILFIVSALVSGTALLIAMYVIQRKGRNLPVDLGMVRSLSFLMIGFLAFDYVLQFYEYLVAGLSMKPDKNAILSVMFTGPVSWSFWAVQIFLGAIIPTIIVASKKTNRSLKALTVAAILVVIGIIGVRFNLVVPTQIVHDFGTLMPLAEYFPNWVEWLSVVGPVAMGLIIYSIGAKYLPLELSEDEVKNHG